MGALRGRWLMAPAGILLIVGFFLPWFRVHGGADLSGFAVLREGGLDAGAWALLFLCPAGGVALLFATITGKRAAKPIALVTGGIIFLIAAYKAVAVLVALTGVGLWIVLAGGVMALFAGIFSRRPKLVGRLDVSGVSLTSQGGLVSPKTPGTLRGGPPLE